MKDSKSDIFEAYGRFVVEFEIACEMLETLIKAILNEEGLRSDQIQDCIIAGMTAEPLCSLAQSICHEHLQPDDKDLKILDSIFTAFRKLMEKRNDIVHGRHHVYIHDDKLGNVEPSGRTFSWRIKKSKRGSATDRAEYRPEDLNLLWEEASLSAFNLQKIRYCIEGYCYLSSNFTEVGKNSYRAIEGAMVGKRER